jgi:hypothetical protein
LWRERYEERQTQDIMLSTIDVGALVTRAGGTLKFKFGAGMLSWIYAKKSKVRVKASRLAFSLAKEFRN